MPAQRPRASFEPISPDFDLDHLVESTPNFAYVDRITCGAVEAHGFHAFEKLVNSLVINQGKPLIIDGFEERLDPWTFTPKWLRDNCGEKVENASNLMEKTNLPLTVAHYLRNMSILTNQFCDIPGAYRDKKRQRMYLKDIDCPTVWWDKLKEHLPPVLAYLNDSTGEVGGPGSVPDPTSNIPGRRLGKGIARAGDLMSSLPPDMRAENLMCYIGHEGTFTPAHREMCASLGHNIMVEASSTVNEDGQVEKPGSSIWFMTESKDRHLVAEYWLSVLGHDIEVENHFAQIVAWKKAPFKVYVVDQRPGDLILIPPLAPHQVWNRGTRTMKVAWNRTTVETLEMAINEALPRSRIVCRDEQYKNKAMIYYTLQKYASLLMLASQQAAQMPPEAGQQHLYSAGKIKSLRKDFRRLFALYRQMLLSEMWNPNDRDSHAIEYVPFDSNITCAYCRGNIFNRFLSCPTCKDVLGHNAENGDGDPYDVCLECYAMGRSCACLSGLKFVEQFRWKELTTRYEAWRKLIIALDGGVTEKTPLSLPEERRRWTKRSLAEICKDQLKRRPFKDVTKASEPKSDEEDDEEIVVGDDGMVKKVKKKRSKAWERNNQPCHVCCHRHPTWKMAHCTTCERCWCYGTLFRGWDKMPQAIMEDPDWSCPHCLGICFAGACRNDPRMTPYEPKGTLLGHDTKKVADARSVEALVDFSVSNLNWIKGDDPENRTQSGRFRRAEAEARKNKEDDQPIDDDENDVLDDTQVQMDSGPSSPKNDNFTSIDPALVGDANDQDDEYRDEHLAHRLQMANSSMPAPTALMSSAHPPDGYVPIADAGYAPSYAPNYPDPADATAYPAYGDRSQSVEYADPSDSMTVKKASKKRRRGTDRDLDADAGGDPDVEDSITMQRPPKAKKPRLVAAGFKSSDLAETPLTGPSASKAKSEAQRQFEKEKERKALDKAKAEGRFIMFSAALRGKKRLVKLRIPGARLAQLVAQSAASVAVREGDADGGHDAAEPGRDDHLQASAAATSVAINEDDGLDILLRSDIPVKKPNITLQTSYQRRLDDGTIVTGGSKKAKVPVERDEDYGYRERVKLPNGKRVIVQKTKSTAASEKKKRGRRNPLQYEEVDIGSSDDDENLEDETFQANSMISGSQLKEMRHQKQARTSLSNRRTAAVAVPSNAAVMGLESDRRSLPNGHPARHEDDRLDGHADDLFNDSDLQREPTGNDASDNPDAQRNANGGFTDQTLVVAERARPTAGKRPMLKPVGTVFHGLPDPTDDEDDINEFVSRAANGDFNDITCGHGEASSHEQVPHRPSSNAAAAAPAAPAVKSTVKSSKPRGRPSQKLGPKNKAPIAAQRAPTVVPTQTTVVPDIDDWSKEDDEQMFGMSNDASGYVDADGLSMEEQNRLAKLAALQMWG